MFVSRECLNTKTPDDFHIKPSGVLYGNRSTPSFTVSPFPVFWILLTEGCEKLFRFRHQDAQEIVFVQIGLGYFLDVLRG